MKRIILQPSGQYTKDDFISNKWNTWAEQDKYIDIWQECVGDTILFVKNKYIFLIATIIEIDYDDKTNPDYPLRYVFNNISYVDISMEDFNKIIGYKDTYFPRNFMLVREEYTEESFNFLNNFILKVYDEDTENEIYQKDIYGLNNNSSSKKNLHQPQFKKDLVEKNGKEYYPRSASIAREALEESNYTCVLDNRHNTFKTKSLDRNYVEAHHLIPLKYHNDFNYSLDIHANIISLCPNCHRMIHLGKMNEVSSMLEILYKNRKEALLEVGLELSLEELKSFYES